MLNFDPFAPTRIHEPKDIFPSSQIQPNISAVHYVLNKKSHIIRLKEIQII